MRHNIPFYAGPDVEMRRNIWISFTFGVSLKYDLVSMFVFAWLGEEGGSPNSRSISCCQSGHTSSIFFYLVHLVNFAGQCWPSYDFHKIELL